MVNRDRRSGKKRRNRAESKAKESALSPSVPPERNAPSKAHDACEVADGESGRAAAPVPTGASPIESTPARGSAWLGLRREHLRPIGLLFGLALVMRIIVLLDLSTTPYFELTNIDTKSYQRMALAIRDGHWMPTDVFYQSGLYSYFLAIVYRVLGIGPWGPRIVQILLGSSSVALVYVIGLALYSPRVGALAGIILALYGPLILEEIVLLKTALIVFAFVSSFALFVHAAIAARRVCLFASGFVLGIAAVGAGQWLVSIPPLAFAVGVAASAGKRTEKMLLVAIFLLGCALPIVPVSAWNTYRGGGLLLTSADAGLNLYLGNNPRATGLPARPPRLRDTPEHEPGDARRIAEEDTKRPMTMAEVSRYWSRQALVFIREHPADFARNILRKVVVLWNAYEVPDNYHYSFMRRHFLPSLNWCLTLAVVGPLSLLGMFLGLRRWRSLLPLYAALLPYLGILVLFYVRGRYRLAVVPLIVLFAAAALERIWRAFEARERRVRLALLSGLLPIALFVNWEYCEDAHHGWPALCFGGETWFDDEYAKLAYWFQVESANPDPRRALAYLDEALEVSRDPHRRAKALFSKGDLSRRLGEESLDRGLTGDAERDLRSAEKAFRECIAMGYRLEASRSQLAVVRERLERIVPPSGGAW